MISSAIDDHGRFLDKAIRLLFNATAHFSVHSIFFCFLPLRSCQQDFTGYRIKLCTRFNRQLMFYLTAPATNNKGNLVIGINRFFSHSLSGTHSGRHFRTCEKSHSYFTRDCFFDPPTRTIEFIIDYCLLVFLFAENLV